MVVYAQQRAILGGTTTFSTIPLNVLDGTSEVTWMVRLDGNGTATYDVEFTLDDVLDADVSAVFDQSVSGQTTSNNGNITVPIRGIRLNITAVSASSNATFRVLQSGT